MTPTKDPARITEPKDTFLFFKVKKENNNEWTGLKEEGKDWRWGGRGENCKEDSCSTVSWSHGRCAGCAHLHLLTVEETGNRKWKLALVHLPWDMYVWPQCSHSLNHCAPDCTANPVSFWPSPPLAPWEQLIPVSLGGGLPLFTWMSKHYSSSSSSPNSTSPLSQEWAFL